MGTTLMLYTSTDITIAFVSTFLMFVIMGLIGFVTEKDLSGLGKACISALLGIIIAILLNFFLHSSILNLIISVVSIIIFSCLIAFDNNIIRKYYENGETSLTIVILMALNLYLDFLNMFSSILNIIGLIDD
jgi:Integral membrane protein, interacts with FtsH